MKSVSFVTLGCKVNQYDTAVILNRLPKSRYKTVPFTEKADVYVIDTCTVTHKADAEARNYIYRAKRANPRGVVVVTGCYAQVSPEELKEVKGVDYVVGNSDKFTSLLKIIREGERQTEPRVFVSDIFKEKKKSFESPGIENFPGRTRAFLKVQDGLGTLAPGRLADIIAVRGDPLRRMDVLRHVDVVVQGGRRVR